MSKRRKRLGEMLVDAGLVDAATLEKALQQQRLSGQRLGRILETMQVVTEQDIAIVLARQFGLQTVANLAKHRYAEDVLKLVDAATARQRLIFPLGVKDKQLHLAMVNPLDMDVRDNLAFATGLKVVPYITTAAEVQAAIKRNYLPTKAPAEHKQQGALLVVDAQATVLRTTMALLEKAGYVVAGAASGQEALERCEQQLPHLVVTDLVLEGQMDGYQLGDELRQRWQRLPVIAISSRIRPETRLRRWRPDLWISLPSLCRGLALWPV